MDVPKTKDGEWIIMKICRVLVDMLIQLDPLLYGNMYTWEGNEKVMYIEMLKALYGMLRSSILYYKKFWVDIKSIGFVVNPYDPCVANHMIEGSQQTVTWHVDDLKSSHKKTKVNDDFTEWLTKKYASDSIGKLKVVRGKCHDYLAMVLDYNEPGVVKVDMVDYIKNMVKDFPEELTVEGAAYPWNESLFKVDPESPALEEFKKGEFHNFVYRALFMTKRAHPDLQPAIAFLTTHVKQPTEQDWFKLKKMMQFLKHTQAEVWSIGAEDINGINAQWHLDAAFAVHPNYKSHTGANLTFSRGSINSVSAKQKTNTQSSTEAELVMNDDIIAKVLWTRWFIEHQDLKVIDNVVYWDNKSTMKLEQNGKASCGKWTRHFNIKYFYITDLTLQRNHR